MYDDSRIDDHAGDDRATTAAGANNDDKDSAEYSLESLRCF